MRRTVLLGASLVSLFGATACQDQVTEPPVAQVEATGPAMSSVGPSAAGIDRPASLVLGEGRVADARPLPDLELINPGNYQCPATAPPVLAFGISAINEFELAEPGIYDLLFNVVWADLLPYYEALLFLEESRKVDFGYEGEFTNQMNRAIKDLRRFSDIDGDAIKVVPWKGSMLFETDRVVQAYMSPLVPPFGPAFGGLSESEATIVAGLIQDAINDSDYLNGGDHPFFSFNAVAFSGASSLGIPPTVLMGDAMLDAYDEFGYGDVAPQAILAHEWAHHVQFANGYFDDPIPTLNPPVTQAEATRYTELMADAWSAYFMTHKRGLAMNQKRVEQFLEVFFQIGDCSFLNPGHHGTPNQRTAAAQFGFDLADQAQKKGHILSSDAFHDQFVDNYLNLIAPDA